MTAVTPAPESFDAFWNEIHGGHRTTTVEGVEVTVPTDVPMGFERRFAELSESSSDDDVAELVTLLFGEDAAAQWLAPPAIGFRKLLTILMWGMAQSLGEDITFREAYDRVQGKARTGPNRAARRAASKKPSGTTGGRSKRTSSASTASTRTASQA